MPRQFFKLAINAFRAFGPIRADHFGNSMLAI
jgi:hypothetical protein